VEGPGWGVTDREDEDDVLWLAMSQVTSW